MNRRRSHITLTFALLALWASPYLRADAGEVEITILHTNDIHQHLDPLPRIAGYVSDYREKHPNTVFVDAGDWFDRGSSLVPLTQGEALYGAMATMGYDMWIVGNHDWAYGGERLIELMARYPVPVLTTNLATTRPSLPPNLVRTVIKEFGGIRVGFFGITLDTYGKSPKGRPNLYVLDCREETAKAVTELKRAGVDLIVAVTHLGYEKMAHEVGRSSHPSDKDLAAENPDIDVIVGGHSHTRLPESAVRKTHQETGAIIVQAGASSKYVGRLTLRVDSAEGAIKSFDVQTVPATDALPEHPETAAFLREQFSRHMPNAKRVIGELPKPIEFHNLAFWYADFIRRQAGTELCLLPRKTLYDEPKSFPAGEINVERMLGMLYDRCVITATVTGSDLLAYCNADDRRHRFNPFHHQGRPFSGDALFYSGFDAVFQPETEIVKFDLDPEREYTLAIPWPFNNKDIRKYRHQLPPREDAGKMMDPVPGLRMTDLRVLSLTTREMLVREGVAEGLEFPVKFPHPRPDWKPWTTYFEAKLKPE